MGRKTGNFTIIAGDKLTFETDEMFLNSFTDIEIHATKRVVKHGEIGGRIFGQYQEENDKSFQILDDLEYRFYHTWNNTNPNSVNVGHDNINVTEIRNIIVLKNGEELKESKERFVTDYFAHINDEGIFDGFAFSTWYYKDSQKVRKLLNQDNYKSMKEVVISYAKEVAKYKVNNKLCSPVQIKADDNRKGNKKTDGIISGMNTLSTVTSIISKIPIPHSKIIGGTGELIGYSASAIDYLVTKPTHADQVAIMFKLKFKKQNNKWIFIKK